MEEPSLHKSRLALAGGLAAAIVVGGSGFLIGRTTTERVSVAATPTPVAAPSPEPTSEPTASRGVLGRADLIALAAAAADATAAGRAPALGDATGRRFELRLPFGCAGPSGEKSNAAMRWRYDADAKALRFNVAPVVWTAADWWSGPAPVDVAAIEGFWIPRPWTASEGCPVGDQTAALSSDSVTLPGQTLALGQVALAGNTRDAQRETQSYDTVVRVPAVELDTSQGFRLRVSGRIAQLPGAGPVRCRQPAGPEQRPICLVAVVVDEVAIENPVGNATLATWNVGEPDTR